MLVTGLTPGPIRILRSLEAHSRRLFPFLRLPGRLRCSMSLSSSGQTKCAGLMENVVEAHHEEAAPHDTFLSAELLGFEKSAWEVTARIGEFVGKQQLQVVLGLARNRVSACFQRSNLGRSE
ncbi:hypothetical protein F4824DRAFT_454114 [Ustulina deusta]|nr:hypothetical protein F4823DRAFT_608695 [Ustulina deusta]KAI3340127.1 hypothetical protein F4824DRAFT_454114 [Ustulina deusta]